MRVRTMIGIMLALGVLAGMALVAHGQGPETPDSEQAAVGLTPPRLGFVDGQVSFWRPGAEDWSEAQVNTPLAPGDQLYTGRPGNLEIQIGARAFLRAGADTQIGLENQEPEFLQFRVTGGFASFDVRTLDPGSTVEVDTPNAAFTIDHAGYYRVDVDEEHSSLIARRGGRATAIPAGGEAVDIASSEEVVIEGTASPQVSSYAAPQLDPWDKWNYARTEHLLDSVSARYVPPGVYGVDDLDSQGTWRVVPDYGAVWVPRGVPAGWAPYTTGSWMLDPDYGWTWVDTAPWGWAPYHYGRWVSVNGYWAWAPGPAVVRPAYCPALVAFFGGHGGGVSVGIGAGGPVVGWVALGWGEPVVPWWGRPGFVDRPSWRGWGGPHVVNNVVINRTTVVNVTEIHDYRNTTVRHALVGVHENRFGHGPLRSAEMTRLDPKTFRPIHGAPRIAASPASFAPKASRGIRPPGKMLERPVVATRPPQRGPGSAPGKERHVGPMGRPMPEPHIVSVPKHREPASALQRAPFGRSKTERSAAGRAKAPSPPKFTGPQGPKRPSEGTSPATRRIQPQPTAPGKVTGSPRPEGVVKAPPSVTRKAKPQAEPKVAAPSAKGAQPRVGGPKAPAPLPGEPASRLAPTRAEKGRQQQVERKATPVRPEKAGQKAPQEDSQQKERGKAGAERQKKGSEKGPEKAPEKGPEQRPGG
jgi:hypothetical protein